MVTTATILCFITLTSVTLCAALVIHTTRRER